jgi:hypothetical protein
MSNPNANAGIAALAICESLLLALNQRKILPEKEIIGLLTDAAVSHEDPPDDDDPEMHLAAAALINAILKGGYLSRREP